MQIPDSWLLFLHGFSSKQSSARVAVWRQLKSCGALPLKTSGHLLPDSPGFLERFQWIARRTRERGGECSVMRVAGIDGIASADIIRMFRDLHSETYTELKKELNEWLRKNARRKKPETGELGKFVSRFEAVRNLDYFDSPAGHEVELLIARVRELPFDYKAEGTPLDRKDYNGRTWQTRPRPQIDRVGSAWLIHRFIDPEAKFVFSADPEKYPDALTYDMIGATFTHEGDDCTFETLIRRFRIEDAAVAAIGEMVHEADLADGKFARTEGLGLDRVFRGWAFQGLGDDEILKQGATCFDAIHAWLSHP